MRGRRHGAGDHHRARLTDPPRGPVERLAEEAAAARAAVRRQRGDEPATVAALRRYDGALARLAEALGVERPPLVDKSPVGRNRRRAEVERLLGEAGIDLRAG